MPRPRKGPRLGSGPDHEKLLLGTLAAQLFTHGRIRTTEARAKAVRPLAEHMITFAKRGDVHARRQVLAMVPDTGVVGQLFGTIAPRFGDRNGGYTRLIKAGRRPGDNAPLVLLELMDRPETPKDKEKKGEQAEKAPRGEAGATGKRKKKEKAAAASA